MIPASERAKAVHALDRSATVTGAPIQILITYKYIKVIEKDVTRNIVHYSVANFYLKSFIVR
jgi:hypothetical protein